MAKYFRVGAKHLDLCYLTFVPVIGAMSQSSADTVVGLIVLSGLGVIAAVALTLLKGRPRPKPGAKQD